jgi:Protein of unknown function (DUF3300)/Chaperone of endosialidase
VGQPSVFKRIRHVIAAAVVIVAVLHIGPGRAQGTATPPRSAAQLEQLVAPIALYPDSLLSQILMASTYPLEVVAAARWSQANLTVTGDALQTAMTNQPWDPSVKALTAVPQTLQMMNDKLDWTQQLGDTFLAQQSELLDAVQRLRARADANGALKSTPEQKVTRTSRPAGQQPPSTTAPANVYVIEPTNPDEYYVPVYDPGVVYGAWPYPEYAPFYWYPPGYALGNVFSFAAGAVVGSAIWANVNWGLNRVQINPLRYNSFNRTNISNVNWAHNPAHRGAVPYRDAGVAQRFGNPAQSAARDDFRGKANAGRQQLGTQQGKIDAANKSGQRAAAKTGAGGKQAANQKNSAGSKKAAAKKQAGAKQAAHSKQAAGTKQASRTKQAAGTKQGAGTKHAAGSKQGAGERQVARNTGAHQHTAARSNAGTHSRAQSAGSGARGGGRRSDVRLKHDLALLGRLDNGIGFYRFSYNGSDKAHVGVIAQEVQTVMPQAVARDRDGYLRVFYNKLGLVFQTYDHWIASGARIPTLRPQ